MRRSSRPLGTQLEYKKIRLPISRRTAPSGGDTGRPWVIWGDVGRCGEIRGDVGDAGAVWWSGNGLPPFASLALSVKTSYRPSLAAGGRGGRQGGAEERKGEAGEE